MLSFLRTRLFLLIHEKLYCKETNPNVESIFFFLFLTLLSYSFFSLLYLGKKKKMEDDQNTQRDEIMVLMGSL